MLDLVSNSTQYLLVLKYKLMSLINVVVRAIMHRQECVVFKNYIILYLFI